MANWREIIISGSDAHLNSLNAESSLTASGLIYPNTDGTNEQVIQTDGSGNFSFGDSLSNYDESLQTTIPGATNTDLAGGETPFAAVSDAFGVKTISTVYSLMDPAGATETLDLGAFS